MLDSGFTGGLAVHFHDSDFAAEITGFFYFLGIRFDIPKITMTVVPSSYEDILKAVLEAAKDLVTKELANHSSALFKQLFETAEKWLKAIADGIIDVAKDAVLVALALKEVFKQTAEWIGRAVRDVLKWGSEAAARA